MGEGSSWLKSLRPGLNPVALIGQASTHIHPIQTATPCWIRLKNIFSKKKSKKKSERYNSDCSNLIRSKVFLSTDVFLFKGICCLLDPQFLFLFYILFGQDCFHRFFVLLLTVHMIRMFFDDLDLSMYTFSIVSLETDIQGKVEWHLPGKWSLRN